MARWKLTQKHYLNVPGIEWEHVETPNGGNRAIKRKFHVPQFLNPDDQSDCNYPGEIIVAYAGSEQGRDIVFEGPPTLDMLPLDEEAKEISAEMAKQWGRQFIGEDDEGGYTGRLLLELGEMLTSFNRAGPSSAVPDDALASQMKVQNEQFAALMEMNKSLLAKLEPRRP